MGGKELREFFRVALSKNASVKESKEIACLKENLSHGRAFTLYLLMRKLTRKRGENCWNH